MQTFEFRKSDHQRPRDRDINDGNKDRKTLRCRTGILALTVVETILHCLQTLIINAPLLHTFPCMVGMGLKGTVLKRLVGVRRKFTLKRQSDKNSFM